jgi:tryptophan-rich sensory protein
MRALLPATLITLTNAMTSKYCKTLEKSSVDIPGRPPGWVFAVVWPLLYITTGIVWSRTKLDAWFFSIIGLCCAWLFVYSCKEQKQLSTLILLTTALLSWKLSFMLHGENRNLMLPFALWTTFATYLNSQT